MAWAARPERMRSTAPRRRLARRRGRAPRRAAAGVPSLAQLDLLTGDELLRIELRIQLLQLLDRDAGLLRDRAERVAGLHGVCLRRQTARFGGRLALPALAA